MATTPSLTAEVAKWAASAPFLTHPRDGYFHFDVVADAFVKGAEHKEKELREKWVAERLNRMTAFAQTIIRVVGFVEENGYSAKHLFMSGDQDLLQAIITVPSEDHDKDDFIDKVYGLVSKIEIENQKERNIPIDISFLDHSDTIDRRLLKDDGYTFQIDLNSGQILA